MSNEIIAVKDITRSEIISSEFLDDLVYDILEADIDNEIELATRLPANVNYGRNLKEHYRPEDIDWVKKKIHTDLNDVELHTLDVLVCWTYRNTGDLVRSAVGLIGAALFDKLAYDHPHDVTAAEVGTDTYNSLISEPFWTVRRLIKTAVNVGAIDAKIPLRTHSDVFSELENIPTFDRIKPSPEWRKRQADLLASVSPTSTLVEANMDIADFAAGRLIQMVKSVSEYKREDNFGRLRSFLTNASMLATLVRIKGRDNPQLARLSSDILDMTHAIDRLLNSNCVAANGLLQRMMRGELVFDEIITMGRHQHRIMAVEFTGLTTVFAYFLKSVHRILNDDKDVEKAIGRLLRFPGISEQYANEIVAKQFNSR